MEDRLGQSLQSRSLLTGLVTLFGISALLKVCLGVYGVVSYGAALRCASSPFGRRSARNPAMSAAWCSPRRVRLWLTGAAIGLVAVWPVGRGLQSQLYGVGASMECPWG